MGKKTKRKLDEATKSDNEVEDFSMDESLLKIIDEETSESENEESETEQDDEESEQEEDDDESEQEEDDDESSEQESDNESEQEDDDESENEDEESESEISEGSDTEVLEGNVNGEQDTSQGNGQSQNGNKDEYEEYDSSDEEDIRNTVGNIPMNWYEEYKHLGYDWDGNKIMKPESGDHLDNFLKQMEDPNFWRTVKDPQTGQNVVLSDQDIELIKRIKAQKIPDVTFDEYAPWIEWFTSEVMKTPIRAFPEHKRSFLPSKSETKKISKLVHALKMGWIKTRAEAEKLRAKKEPQFYMLWETDDQSDEMRRIHKHIPAPKRQLPGHAESYNPPAEYLFDTKEMKEWNKQKNAPWKRKLHFVPQKHDSLRKVPAYPRYIKERFLRCLDLYLCPRGIKMKLNIDPEELVPKLPSPRDLQPFPNVLAMEYVGHTNFVRTISVDKDGEYLASGSDDGTVKFWDIKSGRCFRTIQTEGVVRSIEWCPSSSLSLILIASNNQVILVNPRVRDPLIIAKTDSFLEILPQKEDQVISERIKTTVQWSETIEPKEYEQGYRIVVKHFKEVTQVTWHGRGDYFASVMPDGLNRSVIINQISRRRSQVPFTKSKGLIQRVQFHPTKPFLFVATQRHVRVYDLVKQTLMKTLLTNSKWISTMAVHPGGDNLLVGTYDRKMLWFDLDLSRKPYQTLRLHGTAVRGVAFHKRYPLFASVSDDKSLIVCHGMVYNDLLKNALIVPLKRFQDHQTTNDFGVFDVQFHPLEPFVFTSGADGTIKMYSVD